MRLNPITFMMLASLGATTGCSVFWRYLVPSGRELYSVKAPSDVRLLVEASMLNGATLVNLEIENEARSPLLVRPESAEIFDARGESLPVRFDSIVCDGRTHEGYRVLEFRNVCRISVSARAGASLARAGRLTVRHRGIARDSQWIPVSFAIIKDER